MEFKKDVGFQFHLLPIVSLRNNCASHILSFIHSPFKVMSQPGHDASKVRASGPGLDTKGVCASLPVEFTIDARDAGEGLLTVQILVGSVTFTPKHLTKHFKWQRLT